MGNNEVLAAFNADTVLTPHVLEDCVNALHQNEDWGVLGPHQVDKQGLTTHAGIFGTNDAPQHRAWHQKDSPEYHDIQEAVTVSGSAYFVKRSVWDKLTVCPIYAEKYPEALGAFLPTPHYYEETFCSYHSRAHGFKVMYYGMASMIHKWHTATPLGGWAEEQLPISQGIFREMCDLHGISHD
jgi:GT2 family glycosyltransferase